MIVLEVNDVSIRYITGDFKDIGLKEYVMRRLTGNYQVVEFWADHHITFSLEQGDMLGIIGTNGAGKSTLLKAISGIMEPTGGYVKREGNIAALLELASGFDGDLTVRENTYLRGAMLGYTRKFMDEKYPDIIEFSGLQDFQDRPFKQLSSGMMSRLAFSVASLVQPDILILDEVLSVGDGAFRKKSEAQMREIIQGGATTILVSHSVEQVREMCNKVLWIEKGNQIGFGGTELLCNLYQGYLDGTIALEEAKKKLEVVYGVPVPNGEGDQAPSDEAVPEQVHSPKTAVRYSPEEGKISPKRKLPRKYSILSIFFVALSTLAVLGNPVVQGEEAAGTLAEKAPFLLNALVLLLAKIQFAFSDTGLMGVVVFAGLCFFYHRYFSARVQGDMPKSKLFFALSVLFALLILSGSSYHTVGCLGGLWRDPGQVLYVLLFLIGLTALFYVTVSYLLRGMDRKAAGKPGTNRLTELLLERHPILIPFCVLIVCWLPCWIACFPGSVTYDINYQLGGFWGYAPMSGHHPVFSTLLYGYFLQLARMFFDDTICLALCTAAQFLAMAGSMTYGLYSLRRWRTPQSLRLFALLFFALNPLIPIWLQLLVKDSIYLSFFFAFTVALLNLIFALVHGQPKRKPMLWAMFWGVLASLMRNNGIYIVVPSLLAAVFASKGRKERVRIGACAIFVALMITFITNGLMVVYVVEKGEKVEALSIPLQQTARYVQQYGAELTEEERAVLSTVLDVDALPQVYNPNISDPVKNATVPGYEEHLGEYLLIWVKMFFKHPMVYVDATLHNTYAYFSPVVDSPTGVMAAISIEENPYHIFHAQYVLLPEARTACLNYLFAGKQLPALGLLLRVGTYTWCFLFLAVLAIHRKKYYALIGCVPAGMNLLVCIASPVNGYYRYALPHILTTPVLIGWIVVELFFSHKEETV